MQPPGLPVLPQGDVKTRSLYIGNLAPGVTDQLLWDVFSIIGPVESCKVIRDKVRAALTLSFYGCITVPHDLADENTRVPDLCSLQYDDDGPSLASDTRTHI